MATAASIAGAIEAARAGTAGLQVPVVHAQWVLSDALGAHFYAAPVVRQAFVQEGAMHVKGADGQTIVTKARLGFLGPIAPHGAPGRQEPFDPRDRFVLPSGLNVKVVEVPGTLKSPLTGGPYASSVWLA